MKVKLPNKLAKIAVRILLIAIFLFFLPTNSDSAGFEFTKNEDPVFSFSSNDISFDSKHVTSSFILDQGISFGLWYTGHGNYDHGIYDHWLIGFAEQTKATGLWSRTNIPITLLESPDLPETESTDPFIIRETDGSYKMWYDAYNPPQSGIRYATSTDGKIWTRYPTAVLTGTIGKFDGAGLARGKSVIRNNEGYHMWYTGSSGGGSWGIGYVTSPDGVHWSPQNDGNRIITKTESWEETNMSYPYVFFAYGKYHMFYATGPNDYPTKILYANSTDGLIWNKPSNLNPVLERTRNWESISIGAPNVLIDGTRLKMWYSAYGIADPSNPRDLRWQIAYAEAPLSGLPGVPPKIVIIPGIGGSWNTDALLNCNLSETPPESWKITPYFGTAVYEPIFNKLKLAGYDTFYAPYDWRWDIAHSSDSLMDKLASITGPNEKLYAIGHSMGGLLAKSYLDRTTAASNKISSLLAVGSPFQGSIKAYPAWSAGEIWDNNMLIRIAMTTLINSCGKLHSKTNRDIIRQLMPSVGNLLPRYPFMFDVKTGETRKVKDAINTWGLTSITNPYKGTTVETISGTGFNTDFSYYAKDATKGDLKFNNWLDGKPQKTITRMEGDGTVLTNASQLMEIPNTIINTDHSGLVNSEIGMQTIFSLLGIPWPNGTTASPTEIRTSLLVIATPASSELVDPQQNIHRDVQGMIGFLNPKNGSYRLKISPFSDTTKVIVAQFLPNNKNIWNEYTINGREQRSGTLIFDDTNNYEDPLRLQ